MIKTQIIREFLNPNIQVWSSVNLKYLLYIYIYKEKDKKNSSKLENINIRLWKNKIQKEVK
jgi:hypothetical protein